MTNANTMDRSAKLLALTSLLLGAAIFAVTWNANVDGRLAPPGATAPVLDEVTPARSVSPRSAADAGLRGPKSAAAATESEARELRQRVSAGRAQVRPADTLLDFGTVAPGFELRKTFVLHNDGGKPLVIYGTKVGSGAVSCTYDREIPAGGEGTIEVVIRGNAVKPGRLAHHIEIGTSDPACWMLMVKGTVDGSVQLPR